MRIPRVLPGLVALVWASSMSPVSPVSPVSPEWAVWAVAPVSAHAEDSVWGWPLRPQPEVLRGFDPPAEPWLAGHRGVDLAAEPGQTVYAAGAGVVSFAGDVAGTPVVTVTHGALRTTYLPVDAEVSRGDGVALGAPVGSLSERGRHCARVDCLHWGAIRGSQYRDPLALLGLTEIRLLPVPRE